MPQLKYYLMVALCASSLFVGGRLMAAEPQYTYEQVYDGRNSSRRIVVLDQRGFQLTTVLRKVFAPHSFKAPANQLKHVHPSFWASPDRGAVGFQSIFQF